MQTWGLRLKWYQALECTNIANMVFREYRCNSVRLSEDSTDGVLGMIVRAVVVSQLQRVC